MTQFVSNRGIYEYIVRDIVPSACHRLWIATADIKDMYVDSGGRDMVPFLEVLDGMVTRGRGAAHPREGSRTELAERLRPISDALDGDGEDALSACPFQVYHRGRR